MKINAFVYICTAVTIEDGVMISAGTIFTNDRFPRATTPDLKRLRPSEPDEQTLPTLVREGATIGAGCTIGNDLCIGRFAMIGMGSLVTKSVPDFHLAIGHPARSVGCVCRCGQIVLRLGGTGPRHGAGPGLRGVRPALRGEAWSGDGIERGGLNLTGGDDEMAGSESWGIVGGGILGMTLAHRLAQQGKDVTLFEAADHLGGLADAWQLGDVTWDRHYHVMLLSDPHLRGVLAELGLGRT